MLSHLSSQLLPAKDILGINDLANFSASSNRSLLLCEKDPIILSMQSSFFETPKTNIKVWFFVTSLPTQAKSYFPLDVFPSVKKYALSQIVYFLLPEKTDR